MPPEVRRAFLMLAGIVAVAMVVWAARFQPLPPADFTFQNGTDPKTLDPHRATGQPESRIIFNVFAGLLQALPDGPPDAETGVQPMSAQPSIAKSFTVSEDGKTYTFDLRDDAVWSDGVPITSEDFRWSWTRMLHPETLCQYSFQLYQLPHAEAYNTGVVKVGDRVEAELWDRPDDVPGGDSSTQNFPRGTIRYGTLVEIRKPDEPTYPDTMSNDAREKAEAAWKEDWVYVIDVCDVAEDGSVDWDDVSGQETFCINAATSPVADEETQATHGVLVAFDKLEAIETPDPQTLIVRLKTPVPYFPDLLAYYPTFLVPKHCIEEFGAPLWTKDDQIVCNGPYKIEKRLLRDRIRLRKNEKYFDADQVSIETIDAISTESGNTALNMYETGQLEWVYDPPSLLLDELRTRDDFHPAPMLSVYFYRINVKRPPMDDVRVRRAVAMAIDRDQVVNQITKAGQIPAYRLVPPGMAGYQSPEGFKPDIEEARRLLAEAGYPGGRGFPKLTLLYNTQQMHRAIAEVLQQQLLNSLNIKIELQNMEWGSYLDKVDQINYDIARAGWIADFADPTTFLDLWVTDGAQNSTGWSNKRFDELLQEAAVAGDQPEKRMQLLAEAEQIWIDEMPVIPMYFYVSKNLIKSNVEGFFPTPQDRHPLHLLRLKEDKE
ncbi:Oligopeptide-binding protein OppA precursor [Rubripirellula obstinata]|uniref:Oligopeptide-binding protein OppA n=1 Tax=Rubripirellula obstinata TaxID=406547 RepID=A0A5B1CMJ5_9BACT|nr:peptide ABC transporter substrate-binding protein [Rubripirellula obstinata]KAA1260770.1 Oligopeptide-binding protein OppA precursor [Rubripirellula obstinata]